MMPRIILIIVCFASVSLKAQILSGKYDSDLNIAYNPETKIFTGFYESYSGSDETTGQPRFSCVFYIKGLYQGATSVLESYFPADKIEDNISGKLKIKDSNNFAIRLKEEHGGCWNVNHFADTAIEFKLSEKTAWIEIRYVIADKSFFYKEKSDGIKRKAYLIKGDIVYIDKMEGNWVHCTFYGKTRFEGWMKIDMLNKLS